MNFGIAFSPLVPTYVLWAALAVTLVLAVMLVLARSRGALVRIVALALFVLALANPSLTREDRDPLTSVAAVDHRQEPEPGIRRPHRSRPRRRARSWPSGSDTFPGSRCASSRPASRTAKPTARGCSPRSARRCRMFRATGWRAPS